LGEGHASLTNDSLIRAVGPVGDQVQTFRSVDGGETWTLVDFFPATERVDEPRMRTWSITGFYLDPVNGQLLRLLYDLLAKAGSRVIPSADGVGYGPRTFRLHYQISTDGGRTWGPRQQIIERGDEYNAEHWAKNVWYGRSGAVTEGRRPYCLPDGTIAVGCYLYPTDEYIREVFRQENRPVELHRDLGNYAESFVLLGRWRDDLSGLEWRTGGTIHLPGGYTPAGTCGSQEPALAFLDDDRWFATVRTDTGTADFFRQMPMPVLPWTAVSTDQGRSWGDVRPLRFDDGTLVYVPTAFAEMIRSSKTGKWYWIGNIIPHPTYGQCDPRYPLVIAELDEATLTLRRSTVTVIQDREPEDPPLVRFSNFRVYEHRPTRDFILLMTKSYSELQEGHNGLPHPTYRYRITLPD
jgi:hypothetical protein